MNLPKRDGVNGRYYLIHKPDTDPEVLKHADQCIQDVLDGKAKENHSGYPTVVRNQSGTPFLPDQLVERYLSKLPLKGFPYEEAAAFCDALRRLTTWKEIGYTLEKYIEKQVQERYFEVEGEKDDDDDFIPYPTCTVCPELRPEDVDDGLLRFACYVAVCYTVYGASHNTLTTEHILGLVSQIRPDMVKQLKTSGSARRGILLQQPTMLLLPSALPPKTLQKSATRRFWTICVRYWNRRHFPAAIQWISVERTKSICRFPVCPRRESTSFLPVPCSTLICTRPWNGMPVWRCGNMSSTRISRKNSARCPALSPCLLWDWRENDGHRW